MATSEKLLAFFRAEFASEQASGFARLRRVPDSHVDANLRYFQSLSAADQASFIDCCAHSAYRCYSFVVQGPAIDLTKHPFFARWQDVNLLFPFRSKRNVPWLRAAVSQYKIDRHRGVRGSISEDDFRFAETVRSVKAPELRKRVRAALRGVGYQKQDELGYYCCAWDGHEFKVCVDYGGRTAQLRYVVALAEFPDVHPLCQFCFERTLGMGKATGTTSLKKTLTMFSDCLRSWSNTRFSGPAGSESLHHASSSCLRGSRCQRNWLHHFGWAKLTRARKDRRR
jgi:hypothetical protein